MRKTNRYSMEQLSDAVAMLRKGGLVAVPTETVYGLADRKSTRLNSSH